MQPFTILNLGGGIMDILKKNSSSLSKDKRNMYLNYKRYIRNNVFIPNLELIGKGVALLNSEHKCHGQG